MNKDWKVIHSHFDPNDRITTANGFGNEPKSIGAEVFEFANKDEAINKYVQSINEYFKKDYYDFKGYSRDAVKFYYDKNGKETITYILLHYKDEEYVELTDEELKKAGLK